MCNKCTDYPSPSFVVVELYLGSEVSSSLALARVHEFFRLPVAEVDVVSTSSPLPVAVRALVTCVVARAL